MCHFWNRKQRNSNWRPRSQDRQWRRWGEQVYRMMSEIRSRNKNRVTKKKNKDKENYKLKYKDYIDFTTSPEILSYYNQSN